jgi:hypothetical protein
MTRNRRAAPAFRKAALIDMNVAAYNMRWKRQERPAPGAAHPSSQAAGAARSREPERLFMTTFDKREEGFEAKFAHDEELRFMALARRNKQLAAWASGLMGETGAQADAYAEALLVPDFLGKADDKLVLKVAADLKAKGIERQPQEILGRLRELLAKAISDIEAGR